MLRLFDSMVLVYIFFSLETRFTFPFHVQCLVSYFIFAGSGFKIENITSRFCM